jgi:cytochrome P450
VQPAFHHENIVEYAKVMVECAGHRVDGWRDGESRDIHAEMTQLTLEIVTRALFGASVLDRAADVAKALQLMMEEFTWYANLSFILPDFLPLPISFRLRQGIRLLDKVFYFIIIHERRSNH